MTPKMNGFRSGTLMKAAYNKNTNEWMQIRSIDARKDDATQAAVIFGYMRIYMMIYDT